MTEREDTIERIERVLKLTHKESITVTIPRLTAERAVSMLKEQDAYGCVTKNAAVYANKRMFGGKPDWCPLKEIVTCKECKYWQKRTGLCLKLSGLNVANCTPPEWYCAGGEKRDGECSSV